mmetsp:Transcript_4699/g.15595  ORF Transcript_4699/g.15595 Transcript_4699/m.15595 type:complete len:322 (+) Transcript_4699:1664-2629(+)
MANVAKHDPKEVGEEHHREDPGVHLAVLGHAVGVHEGLEARGHLAHGQVGRWREARGHVVEDGRRLVTRLAGGHLQRLLERLLVAHGDPPLGDENLAARVEVAHVERVVGHLLPLHGVAPLGPLVRHCVEVGAAHLHRPIQEHRRGAQVAHHRGQQRVALLGQLGQRVAHAAKVLADLDELLAEHAARKKDDDHVLEHRGPPGAVIGVQEVVLVHGHVVDHAVAARHPEDDALKLGRTRARDHAHHVLQGRVVGAGEVLVGHEGGEDVGGGGARRRARARPRPDGRRRLNVARRRAARVLVGAQGALVDGAAHLQHNALLP